MENPVIIEKVYQLPFPPDRVFAAWVSSETVIPPATAMDIDPVVGGHYRLIMKTEDFEGRNEGKFLEVENGTHLRYTWEWNGDGEISEIDVRFSESETGTQVELRHSKFLKQESVDNHSSGWDSYMTGFAEFLAKS